MTSFGYTLSSEEHGPQTLVDNAGAAEELGFDFVSISDHYHPWVTAQGHSPFVWSVLGAIAASTERIGVGVGVTCPIMRIHPAVLAQAAATTSLLFDGRFFFGVGTGEALNEHIAGQRWPRPEIRREMLEEAIDVMRQLWTGDTVDHRGAYYEVENARVFDPPSGTIPVIVSGFGTEAAELSGRIGDGYWGNSPEREPLDAFEKAGGSGPRYAQLNLCWAGDEAEREEDGARDLAQRRCRRPAVTGPAHVDPLRAGGGAAHRGAGHGVGPVRPRHHRRAGEERAPVRRRRVRPPLLPQHRARPGGLLPLLGVGAQRRGSRTRTNLRQLPGLFPGG